MQQRTAEGVIAAVGVPTATLTFFGYPIQDAAAAMAFVSMGVVLCIRIYQFVVECKDKKNQ